MTSLARQPSTPDGTAIARSRGGGGRLSITALGMSLGPFFVISYTLCVAYGLSGFARGMHQLLPMVLPGFRWLTWPSFLLGLAESFAYGWYIALVFAPLYNLFAARTR